ncbi:hypothetical protein [Microcystis sp. M_OC_Ca_00000000_C217Col]|uniref:hypothetical protein n=1 Tax=Microcystis sp. M_OC_Ca_00000000_C217Col TaxID=2486213 RepID=UPI00258113EE|nr:hypothetical protein [Microcystis sp. M_OC_Ca_00000000_C217Col]
MADYILLRQAERYLERMPKNDQIRILEALDTLISDSTKLDIKPLYGRCVIIFAYVRLNAYWARLLGLF